MDSAVGAVPPVMGKIRYVPVRSIRALRISDLVDGLLREGEGPRRNIHRTEVDRPENLRHTGFGRRVAGAPGDTQNLSGIRQRPHTPLESHPIDLRLRFQV